MEVIVFFQAILLAVVEMYVYIRLLYANRKVNLDSGSSYYLEKDVNWIERFEEVVENNLATKDCSQLLEENNFSIVSLPKSDLDGTEAFNLLEDLKVELAADAENELSINDWLEEHIEIPSETNSSANTNKIADEIFGVQNWMVSVCGIEQDYIHVFDGSRVWLHVGSKVDNIRHGDVLLIQVERTEKDIQILNIELLQRANHQEYCIPDEMDYLYYDEELSEAI